MGMGGRLNYVDGEGKPFEVEVVGAFKGSMLQGALFIKEDDFLDKFKQQGGYRSFMLTGNKEDAQKLAVHLEDRLFQHGMEFRDSLEKLAELQKVENTYLSIFQGLGGLGMLIGTCGLGLVVVRNLVERGQEFALFEAIGYQLNYHSKKCFSRTCTIGILGNCTWLGLCNIRNYTCFVWWYLGFAKHWLSMVFHGTWFPRFFLGWNRRLLDLAQKPTSLIKK